MSKIIIHMNVLDSGEYDIFRLADYKLFNKNVCQKYGNECPNIGNKLWFQGIISEISDGTNEITIWNGIVKPEEINEQYDFMIAPMANIFAVHNIKLMERLADYFKKIKIPVYVIACGVQSGGYEKMEELISNIKKPSVQLIDAIYQTGGEFALRGYFSKEFFDKLRFPSAVVTGCPSLYQLGKSLHVIKRSLTPEELKPVFNGDPYLVKKYASDYRDSIFVDQHVFYNQLYDKKYFEQNVIDNKYVRTMIRLYGMPMLQLLTDHRVKLFLDMPVWRNYLRNNQFNFAIGNRIHGNIMSILSGIPTVMYACDSRTKEMAEFFHIPVINPAMEQKKKNLFDSYSELDYTDFNRTYQKNLQAFERFLINKRIVSKLNANNLFFKESFAAEPEVVNQEALAQIKSIIDRKRLPFTGYEAFYQFYRSFR